MSDKPKIRTIGARKAPTPLTVEKLMVFAERLIRSDGEAAMRSQDGVDDLVQPSNDSRESKPASLSSLEKLSGARSGIKIKRESDDQTDNVVPFNPKKKQSE